jgi:serine/threonine-protein kinase
MECWLLDRRVVKLRADFPNHVDAGSHSSDVAVRGKVQRRSLDAMTGKVVAGRYRLGRTLGAGGMGFVYEAVDLHTGIEVALKALPPGVPDPTRVKRLRREAAAGAAIRNDHVCRVDYLGVDSGSPFIVMERLHGYTLRTYLDRHGPFELQDAVGLMLQLLDALVATHAAGVIHRDVKPSNVFLSLEHDGTVRVKLIDFGLAKLTGAHELNQRDPNVNEITTAESMIGTLQYLAPEHLLAVGEVDERSDVYSAGLTLFEMLTAHRAFKGSYAEMVHEIILGDVPRARAFRSDLPAVIDDVLAHAAAKTRDRRFASAQAFTRALQAVGANGVSESGVCCTMNEPRAERTSDPLARSGARHIEDGTEVDEASDDDLPTVRPPPIAARPQQLTGFEDMPTARYRPDDERVAKVLAAHRRKGG